MDQTREELFFAAQLCDNAERYEDMVDIVRKMVVQYPDLTERERELLASAYKYLIGQLRNSWRIAAAIQQREQQRSRKIAHRLQYCEQQLANIEQKFLDLCGEIQRLVDEVLIPKTSDTGARVFFLKMKGDYYRYLCEIYQQNQTKLNETSERALFSYGQASDESALLSEADTVRLGLALNFSVFYYEIEQNIEMACDVAHTAYENGMKKVGQGNQDDHKEAVQILSLIRDNLVLWRQDQVDDNQEEVSQEDQ